MNSHPSKRAGFTLLELLIAMTLMGMLLVMLYSSLHFGMRGWDRGEEHAETINRTRIVQEFIRRQLRQAVSVYRNDEIDGRVVYFVGEPDRIGWVAPMLEYLGLGGLYFMQLDIVNDSDDISKLRIRWYPYRQDNEDDVIESDDAHETVLLDKVNDFELSYFGAEDFDEDPEWYDTWESKTIRPSLIRLRMKMDDVAWPEMVVAVEN